MIPLQKLAVLPRSQCLRKAANFVGGAEHRFVLTGNLPDGEGEYLGQLLRFLTDDAGLPSAAAEALKYAGRCFAAAVENEDGKETRRALNTLYHILLTETGRYQADWDFVEAGGALDASKRRSFSGMQVYLEDIRSPFNVGSMFRAAESFGAEKIWLSPLCADPRHKRAERTALGCVDIVPWERLSQEPFTGSRAAGAGSFSAGPFFALETGGIPLEDFSFPSGGIMIVGSEELGVSPQAIAASGLSLGKVSIPMYGAKASLNVSVAFGIVMQAWAAFLCRAHSI